MKNKTLEFITRTGLAEKAVCKKRTVREGGGPSI